MAVITLTSDWGTRDHYVAVVKGLIFTQTAEVTVVDISHQIPMNDTIKASIILKNTCFSFPEKTVHIVEVNAASLRSSAHIAIEYNNHCFIGPDNGLFPMAFGSNYTKCISLQTDFNSSTFPSRDIYVKAACHLIKGGNIEDLGETRTTLRERNVIQPVFDGTSLTGTFVYVDDYGNLISNINREMFSDIAKGRKFNIYLRKYDYEFNEISECYDDVPEGEKLAVFNSSGMLEIAVNNAKASSLLGLHYGDTFRINFE